MKTSFHDLFTYLRKNGLWIVIVAISKSKQICLINVMEIISCRVGIVLLYPWWSPSILHTNGYSKILWDRELRISDEVETHFKRIEVAKLRQLIRCIQRPTAPRILFSKKTKQAFKSFRKIPIFIDLSTSVITTREEASKSRPVLCRPLDELWSDPAKWLWNSRGYLSLKNILVGPARSSSKVSLAARRFTSAWNGSTGPKGPHKAG